MAVARSLADRRFRCKSALTLGFVPELQAARGERFLPILADPKPDARDERKAIAPRAKVRDDVEEIRHRWPRCITGALAPLPSQSGHWEAEIIAFNARRRHGDLLSVVYQYFRPAHRCLVVLSARCLGRINVNTSVVCTWIVKPIGGPLVSDDDK
jgi:hypothetical protein